MNARIKTIAGVIGLLVLLTAFGYMISKANPPAPKHQCSCGQDHAEGEACPEEAGATTAAHDHEHEASPATDASAKPEPVHLAVSVIAFLPAEGASYEAISKELTAKSTSAGGRLKLEILTPDSAEGKEHASSLGLTEPAVVIDQATSFLLPDGKTTLSLTKGKQLDAASVAKVIDARLDGLLARSMVGLIKAGLLSTEAGMGPAQTSLLLKLTQAIAPDTEKLGKYGPNVEEKLLEFERQLTPQMSHVLYDWLTNADKPVATGAT